MRNLVTIKLLNNLILVCALLSLPLTSSAVELSAKSAVTTDKSLPIFSRIYDPKRDPIADGIEALKIASANNRKVIIEVGGNWCAWCHKLDNFIHSHPKLKKDFFDTFVLVKVNVSEENDNQEFLKVFPKTFGYPHMYVTDEKGKILQSKDTGEFLKDKRYSVERFYTFINRWKAK